MSSITPVIDYLTLTFKPNKDVDMSVENLIDLFAKNLYFSDYLDKFQLCGRDRHYIAIYRYNDIQFKVCSPDRIYNQGLCLEMSGNGFRHWANGLPKDITVRDVLRRFRAFSVCGFKANVSRIDIALDDIARGDEKPILHMSTISKKWASHGFCSRSQANSVDTALDFKSADEGFFKVGKQSVNKKRGVCGQTVYFGHRKSAVCVRFYDKKAEQLQKGNKVDEDITSWVRCEHEYKKSKALAIATLFIENDFPDFVEKYKRVVMGHLRFINPDDSNRSRCSTCGWWINFLECVRGDKLPLPKPKTVQFRRSVNYMYKLAPTLYALMACFGTDKMLNYVFENGRARLNVRHLQIIADYMDGGNDIEEECPNLWAVIMSFCWYDDYEAALKQLKKDSVYINFCPEDIKKGACSKLQWLQQVFPDVL